MTRAFPEKSFSGIGGISEFRDALNYFLLGCGTVQVCTAAMLDHAVGPNVIKRLIADATEFLEKNAVAGLARLRGHRRPAPRARRAPLADPAPRRGRLPGRPRAPGRLRRPRPGPKETSQPMSTTLVRNGTIVTASDRYAGRHLHRQGCHHADRPGPHAARRHRGRRLGQARDAGRHRRPHPPRHAVRRHHLGRRLRDRHASRPPTAAPPRSSTSRSRTSARASTRPSRPG